MPDSAATAIDEAYLQRTPGSARLMERAARHMPRGITRSLSWFAPYPVVFERGSKARLHDVDGNVYIDLFSNGLSLMHGHAHPEIDAALREALSRGTAWPGASDAQIEFAELLCSRLPGAEQLRYANTGTEAAMLAVKIARYATGKQMIVKAWHAYHGSYDDLEAGLQGQGEVPGRVALAQFGDLESFARIFERHAGELAAVIVEPVQYTGIVTPPPDGFLAALRDLAREAGVLFVLDDCLMFRLAEGGSAERFGIDPDITCLGKWIGGGLPVGAVTSSAELMGIFDPLGEHPLYHGGSFNGNLLGCVAGKIAVSELDAATIGRVERHGDLMRSEIAEISKATGVPLHVPGLGSVFGLYVLESEGGEIDLDASALLHKAAVNHGVYYGTGGEFGLNTALSDDDVSEALAGLRDAVEDVAVEMSAVGEPA